MVKRGLLLMVSAHHEHLCWCTDALCTRGGVRYWVESMLTPRHDVLHV